MSKYVFKYDKSFAKALFVILLLAICVFCVTTTINVIKNPYAARIANSEWLENRFEGNEMVGLYGFIYMCVLMAPMLLHLIQKKCFRGFVEFLVKVSFLLIFVMIIFAGYMIAIFLLFGSCIIMWSFAQKNFIKSLIALSLFALFIIFYQQIIDSIFTYLMNLFEDNPVYYNKFRDFREVFLKGDISGETVEGRFKNYLGSLKNVYHYPVLGQYFYAESSYGGGHSAIFDVMGRYGWAAIIIFVYLFFVNPHKIDKNRRWIALNYVVLISTIVFSVFDPFFQEIGIAIYFVYPFAIKCSEENFLEGNE
jgi:hypothetical protein